MAAPLNYAAQEAGFNILGKLSDGIPHFQTNAFIARRGWAEKNRPTMVRFMKAHVQAMRWLFDNKDAAVDFLSQEMKLKPLHARLGWEFYTQNRHWPPDGDVTMEGMKNNIRIYAELTGLKGPLPDPAKYVDRSYLVDALKELERR
jgi:ABC-type nitrate/sulfonate/bicarbonate transport system substrate-binding protein